MKSNRKCEKETHNGPNMNKKRREKRGERGTERRQEKRGRTGGMRMGVSI